MPDNTHTTRKPRYRKKLNKEQLAVLELLYTFRFATSEQVARYFGKKTSRAVQKRLKILEDQSFIAKRYDKSYKLKGKPAAYYLLPKGARALAALSNRDEDEPININGIYKDKNVSDSFITHCLNILSTYLQLTALYANTFELFTKSDLRYEQYDYYPQSLPDAHIRLKTNKGRKEFFLDIFEESQPFFVRIRRIKKYLDYAESGDWENDELPIILMVAENTSAHKRLRKRIAKELGNSYEEVVFATANIQHLLDSTENKGRVWMPIGEDGDDPDEPVQPVTLGSLQPTGI